MILARRTKADSWMLLDVIIDESGNTASVEIEEDSQLLLLRLAKDEAKGTCRTLLDLPIGEVMIKLDELPAESKFEVKTPANVAGVRGTRFSVKVEFME